MNKRVVSYLIWFVVIMSVILVLPREDKIFRTLGIKGADLRVQKGLDLQGGAYLTYQADFKDIPNTDRSKALNSTIEVINRRINPGGAGEVIVQTAGSDRILVQLPGVTDLDSAISRIGRSANMKFLEIPASNTQNAEQQQQPIDTGITGKDLDSAQTGISSQDGKPIVTFKMKSSAIKKFADLTTRINQSGGALAIILDDQVLFNGAVSSPITNGQGELNGGFKTLKEANDTAVLLNAGALPVPIKLVEQRTIGASLGDQAINKSLIAGIIGIFSVMVFMIINYKLSGLIASVALVIYTMINIAVFKLSGLTSFSIVLSLAGIAGFILSIGMAVDANILIFERMKEEYAHGKDISRSLFDGFDRAFSSIKDSNISTIITCLILYWFGAPTIKGFALTLALGVLISLLTAITISRRLMAYVIRTYSDRLKPSYFGLRREEG